ncbi:zinc-dependent alcohol dehydrogenase [Microbacterium mangrovi]|uniref:zinc-dependent alcohol dehydrogenase n=1 Tax=Microbacterium mangrovi TaxID=1348253 RepID=UPI0006893EBA|nr:alcohol dehydrogenase catalytic domain-containing protein [Microbacterium mangrovi]
MRAFVVRGPRDAGVEDVPEPSPAQGEVLIDVRRAGVCGTDAEFFSGEMQYLHDGNAQYPIRLGHEWMGIITGVGEGVETSWVGRRVTGDTMLGCGACHRCAKGRHHVCENRTELGIRGGRPGALAEKLAYPARYLHPLPDSVDDAAGALIEPAGNALRSVWAAEVVPGDRVLVLGIGTIGLLVAMFARAEGADVHLMGRSNGSMQFARSLHFDAVWDEQSLPDLPWDAVIDCSNAAALPAKALELVEPAGRVVYVGLAGSPSTIDTRTLALKDVTAVGILGASAALDGVIAAFASGAVDPRPLVAATVTLEDVAAALRGELPTQAGPGPKIHVSLNDASTGGTGKEDR